MPPWTLLSFNQSQLRVQSVLPFWGGIMMEFKVDHSKGGNTNTSVHTCPQELPYRKSMRAWVSWETTRAPSSLWVGRWKTRRPDTSQSTGTTRQMNHGKSYRWKCQLQGKRWWLKIAPKCSWIYWELLFYCAVLGTVFLLPPTGAMWLSSWLRQANCPSAEEGK